MRRFICIRQTFSSVLCIYLILTDTHIVGAFFAHQFLVRCWFRFETFFGVPVLPNVLSYVLSLSRLSVDWSVFKEKNDYIYTATSFTSFAYSVCSLFFVFVFILFLKITMCPIDLWSFVCTKRLFETCTAFRWHIKKIWSNNFANCWNRLLFRLSTNVHCRYASRQFKRFRYMFLFMFSFKRQR